MTPLEQVKTKLPNHNFTKKELEMLELLSEYHNDYEFLLGSAVILKNDDERDRLIRHIKAGGSTTETDLCLAMLALKRERIAI